MNVVVLADYEVVNQTGEVVIGVDSKGLSYLLRPEGKFTTTDDTVVITGVGNKMLVYRMRGLCSVVSFEEMA